MEKVSFSSGEYGTLQPVGLRSFIGTGSSIATYNVKMNESQNSILKSVGTFISEEEFIEEEIKSDALNSELWKLLNK